MGIRKRLWMLLLILVLLGSVAAGFLWNYRNYVLVDFTFYPRGIQQLDLRGEEISPKHYRKILRRIPGCEVLWDVPFQEGSLPNTATEITVTKLSDQDLRNLEYFPELEIVHAEACTDYDSLLKLQQSRPEVQVRYTVQLGGEKYSGAAERIALTGMTAGELPQLAYLPNLKSVLCGGGETAAVSALQEYCREHKIEFLISLGGEVIAPDAEEVTADAVTEAQLGLLQFLPELKTLRLRQPETAADSLLALRQALPDVEITWEREVCGTVFSSDTRDFDFSGVKITSLEKLAEELAYFPEAETVFLGECGLDNEALASHREQVREDYQLIWTVSLGKKLKSRTDATTFMPVREHVYYFNDEEAYNLRYCEDMVCIDIGHMSIHNIDFVEYMPDLEYLILAHTQLQYIEPIRHCKKLKFLELDWSPLKDLTPLKECTALEDLNLGNTFADFTPIKEMTWLKNLWMVDCSTRARYEMTQALPDTRVMVTGAATVDNGWRDLENYYAMRDLLGMYYMSW